MARVECKLWSKEELRHEQTAARVRLLYSRALRCAAVSRRPYVDRAVPHSRLRSCKNDLPPNLGCSHHRSRAPHGSCSDKNTLSRSLVFLYWLTRSGRVTSGHVPTLQMRHWLYRRGARSMRSMGADYVIIAHSSTYARRSFVSCEEPSVFRAPAYCIRWIASRSTGRRMSRFPMCR